MSQVIAYIGLSSNLSDPVQQVHRAFDELAELRQTQLITKSKLYLNPPMGPQDQPDYINAVVQLSTKLQAEELMEELQALERLHQRERIIHWGPRTLDLDMLLYGHEEISSERLKVPHPGLKQRIFVVQPLLEIAPELILPDGTKLASLMKELGPEMTGITI
ncbi:MAG: 2-amino-4-hydroxy-6-hydroxymethyldihydropteridine diphosphokinase [Gammaproteobacteria bacterium]|nr:2-amino-4-hydroxy-6-hydroxymethyldihydropteridine diphosphokinase [Gammaproteobacteria bacterium]